MSKTEDKEKDREARNEVGKETDMTEGHDSRNPGHASWILNWY